MAVLERRFAEDWAPQQEPSNAGGALELLKALRELSEASRGAQVVEVPPPDGIRVLDEPEPAEADGTREIVLSLAGHITICRTRNIRPFFLVARSGWLAKIVRLQGEVDEGPLWRFC